VPITASAKGRGRAGNPKVVIRVRPRQADATVNLRPYEELKLDGAPLALNAARRALAISAEDGEGVSPFLRETFEPILRACQSQIDAEGRYLPDSDAVDPSAQHSLGSRIGGLRGKFSRLAAISNNQRTARPASLGAGGESSVPQ
jgi:hypothetical protein